MKKWFAIGLVLGVFVSSLFGAEFRGNKSVLVARGDTVQADLFGASRFITIDGTVEGDAFGACEIYRVDGTVQDNVIAAARLLIINGVVNDVVVAFAQTIQISGEVNGDVIVFCKEIQIMPGARIRGSLYVGAGELMLDGGTVEGDVQGGAGEAFLNGTVGGTTELEVKTIRFGENYRATNTKLTLFKPLNRREQANLPENLEVQIKKRPLFFLRFRFYWTVLGLFITGLLVYLIFRTPVNEYLDGLRQDFWKKLLTGFLTFVAVPVATLFLFVLVFTVPVALIVGALYLILLYLGYIFGALSLGEFLLQFFRKERNLGSVLVSLGMGVVLVVLLAHLPFVGWLVKLLVLWFGLGGILVYFWQLNPFKGVQKA